MERILWLIIMLPISILFTALGIYAWRRKKPMWFWSGSTVREDEISDVRAYNRANGIMWLAFSGVFWIAAVLGLFQLDDIVYYISLIVIFLFLTDRVLERKRWA